MAIIECPECKKSVSTSAKACPGCGYPVSTDFSTARQEEMEARKKQDDEARMLATIDHNLVKSGAPSILYTMNTIGCRMFGFFPVFSDGSRVFGLSLHAFCILFIPVIPSGIYLVERDGRSFRFYGHLPTSKCLDALGQRGVLRFVCSIFGEAILMIVVLIAALFIVGFLSWALHGFKGHFL